MFPITLGGTKVNFLLHANQEAFNHYKHFSADPVVNSQVLSFVAPIAQLVSASERLMAFDWLSPLALYTWLRSFWYILPNFPGPLNTALRQIGEASPFIPLPILNPEKPGHVVIFQEFITARSKLWDNLNHNLEDMLNVGWSPKYLSDCNPTGIPTSVRNWSFSREFKASTFGSHHGVIVHDKKLSDALAQALKTASLIAPAACGIAAYGNDVFQIRGPSEGAAFAQAVNKFFIKGSGNGPLMENHPPKLTAQELVALHPYGTAYMSSVVQYTSMAVAIDLLLAESPAQSDPKLVPFGHIRIG